MFGVGKCRASGIWDQLMHHLADLPTEVTEDDVDVLRMMGFLLCPHYLCLIVPFQDFRRAASMAGGFAGLSLAVDPPSLVSAALPSSLRKNNLDDMASALSSRKSR